MVFPLTPLQSSSPYIHMKAESNHHVFAFNSDKPFGPIDVGLEEKEWVNSSTVLRTNHEIFLCLKHKRLLRYLLRQFLVGTNGVVVTNTKNLC